MKVAIIGSRTARLNIAPYIPVEMTVLISGGARGIDSLAEAYADRFDIPKQIFLPDYDTHGKYAPLVRDRQIVDAADMVVAIWDGISTGTKYTIDYAHKSGKPVTVYKI